MASPGRRFAPTGVIASSFESGLLSDHCNSVSRECAFLKMETLCIRLFRAAPAGERRRVRRVTAGRSGLCHSRRVLRGGTTSAVSSPAGWSPRLPSDVLPESSSVGVPIAGPDAASK